MPDRRKTKSKYTVDRRIPGAFEGETVTRRRFMTVTANVAGGVAVAAFTLPAIGFAAGPIFEEIEQPWQDVGDVEEFPNDSYVPKVISIPDGSSKMTSAVSGIVRASFTAKTPPWAESDDGASSPTIQRITSK